MIYDVKFDGRRKARFVAGGHLTMDPGEMLLHQTVRLGMFAAVHNNLKVLAADVGNAYLHAKRTMRNSLLSYQKRLDL